MPLTNIVPIEEIDACIEQVVAKINAGVAKLRDQGIYAQLPESVEISMTVVRGWQTWAIESKETGTTTEKQTGSTLETSTSTEKSEKTATSEKNGVANQAHNERGEELSYATTA